jgi:predicted flap endonuclease-1-like 5' DNA nuclease
MQVAEEAGEVVAKLTGEIPQSDPAPMPSLLEIDGIGPATVRDLAGNGIHTLVDLLAWDPEPLADTLNRNTPAQVTAWQVEARQMLEEMAALRAE